MYGSSDGHSACLTLLMQRGALVEAKDSVRVAGGGGIDGACAYAEVDSSYECMRCGFVIHFHSFDCSVTNVVCPMAWSQRGNTALMIAAYMGYLDCVTALLKGGAEVDAKNAVCECPGLSWIVLEWLWSVLWMWMWMC